MKYTAKDLMKFLDIGRETLRYYEQMGLLHPEIDDYSHYRYYSDFDVASLLNIREMRSEDLSVQEIRQLSTISDLSQYERFLGNKADYYQEKADYYSLLKEKNKEHMDLVHWAEENTCRIEDLSVQYCSYSHVKKNSFDDYSNWIDSSEKYNHVHAIRNEWIPFADQSILFEKTGDFFNFTNFNGGLSFSEKWCRKLGIPTESLEHFPACTCVTFLMKLPGDLHVSEEQMVHIQKIMSHKQIKPSNHLFLLNTANMNGLYYFKCYLPMANYSML